MNVFVTGKNFFAGGALVRDSEAKTAQAAPDAAVECVEGHTINAVIVAAHRSGLTP